MSSSLVDCSDALGKPVKSQIVCRSPFQVPLRYTIIKPIGQGAYGVVCSAHDNETGEKVAIKKVNQAFYHPTDTKRTLREIKLLRHFNHENIISLTDLLVPVPSSGFQDIYFVCELMDTDLHQIIRSPQELSDDHCQYFLYQILRAMKYIHSAEVLHRDLKPSNLLLNANCDLKVCDFGLARAVTHDKADPDFMTEYVATRWYRAPEILLSWPTYSKAVDMWSIGCIFSELLDRNPLFPGKNYKHQVDLIVEVLGTPSDQVQMNIQSSKARAYVKALPLREPQRWERLLPNASPLAIDLLSLMLAFDPSKRCTVEQALAHPYLASLHDVDDEPACEHKLDFSWDKPKVQMEELRRMTYEEIRSIHTTLPPYEVFIKTVAAAPPPTDKDGGAAAVVSGAGEKKKDGAAAVTEGLMKVSVK